MSLNPEVARLLEILAATAQTPITNPGIQPQPPIPPVAPGATGSDASLYSSIPGSLPFPQLQQQQHTSIVDPRASAIPEPERQPYQQPVQPVQPVQPPLPSHPSQQARPEPQQPRRVEPSIITQWPAALRYVMGTLARDEAAMAKIKKMKTNQHENERRWWTTREAIVQKHQERVEGQKKVDELLRNIGSILIDTTGSSTAPSLTAELQTFDLKVHRAATDMGRAMTMELSQLGVPFFSGGPGGTICVDGEYGIVEEELMELRRRMVELLGDMVAEE